MTRTYNKWTPEQEAFLRDNFEKHTNKELAEMLGVTLPSMQCKAFCLRLARSKAAYSACHSGKYSSQWKGGITINDIKAYNRLRDRRYRWGKRAEIYRKHQRARAAVRRALLKGILQKGVCAVCGAVKTDGHHEDYDKPLDVIWLCRKHHDALTRQKRAEDKAKAKAAI